MRRSFCVIFIAAFQNISSNTSERDFCSWIQNQNMYIYISYRFYTKKIFKLRRYFFVNSFLYFMTLLRHWPHVGNSLIDLCAHVFICNHEARISLHMLYTRVCIYACMSVSSCTLICMNKCIFCATMRIQHFHLNNLLQWQSTVPQKA